VSSGKAHDVHGVIVGLLGGLLIYLLTWDVLGAACLYGGVLFGTFFLSPDLDMNFTRPYRRWGPLSFLWWPYAKLFDHRGWSHGWIIGPVSRIVYLGIPVYLIWYQYDFQGAGEWIGWLLVGIVLGNWIHLIGDRIG